MIHRVVDSPIGPLVLAATEEGVAEIRFGLGSEPLESDGSSVADAHLGTCARELQEYFAGARSSFDVPLDRRPRRGFRGEVLDALERVRFGETVTYGELAARTGRPRAARAVGTAMATNPIAIIVPCHRVLPTAGGVGNYAGGPAAKEFLLRLEGSSR